MNVTLLFSLLLASILFWVFIVSKLQEKPWLDKSVAPSDQFMSYPSQQIGLWVFMAVASSLFMLFIVIYSERATFSDWVKLDDPSLLWLNTAILALSSVVMQLANNLAGQHKKQIRYMWVAFFLTTLFVVGQFLAWVELNDAGIYLKTNPANSFFYLFTLLHAIHLFGGMVALARVLVRKHTDEIERDSSTTLSIKLCTTYWHFLLLLWLALFYFLVTT